MLFPFYNFPFPFFLEVIRLDEAYQPLAMRHAPAFAIHQDVRHRCPLASEELAHDFLLLVVLQAVESDDAKGRSVAHHISIHYLATLLALELLRVILPTDAVVIELEVVALCVGTESHRFGIREFFFHLHPVVFFQPHLDEDDAPVFVEVERLLGQFPSDEQFDGDERTAFGVEQSDVGMMSFDVDIRG